MGVERETVKTKKEMWDRVAEHRAEGWNVLSFRYDMSELERGDTILQIERIKRKGAK